MRLFLDTSVLLAASGSATGASREIFRRSSANDWILLATPYVLAETTRNLSNLPATIAHTDWELLKSALIIMNDVLVLDRPAVFSPAKDRPILFSALAWADVLLTLDHGDFGGLMERPFYGLPIMKPGDFLQRERKANRLR